MRTVLAVIAGYAVVFIFIMTSFTLAFMAGGEAFAFLPGTVDVTPMWLLMATALNFVAGCLGGWIASVIGKERGAAAVRALAMLLVTLGLVLAVVNLVSPRKASSKPVEQLTASEAAQVANQPTWYEFLVPFVGALGVIVGGRRREGGDILPADAGLAPRT